MAQVRRNQPTVHYPGEGRTFTLGGTQVTIKTPACETNGAWSAIEMTIAARHGGPLPHYHQQKTESYYVLAGRMVFMLDWQEFIAPAGTMVLIKPGMVHTYWNAEALPAKMLLVANPGGGEKYYEDMATLAAQEGHWPPENRAKVVAITKQHDHFAVWE